MSEEKPLPLVPSGESLSYPGRREVLQVLLGAAAAGIAAPALAADHPLAGHLADSAAIEQAASKAKASDWKPEFLDKHQFAMLQSLAERIVPGSSRAKVSEFIDQLLAVDSQEDQRSFLNALGAFEAQALQRARRSWAQLSASDQDAILTEASTSASGRPAHRPWTRGEPIVAPAGKSEPIRLTLRDHFELLKGWIAGAYYSSEIGMRELGWTGNVFHQAFSGCDHPDGHA
jgi:hypothetical protein